ncbi:MAG: Dabb family protein [Peptococcaceae bacterium]|nr:Dabb family protein [Peptococcaceae bacterium]
MVRHVVMWTFLEEVPQEERLAKGQELKEAIEGLKEIIPGVQHLKVEITPVGTSTHHIFLDSIFDSLDALNQYQVHPEHVSVAQRLKQVAGNRACFDYES